MKIVAVVLASGSGQRFEALNTPKHLTPVLDVPVIVWTLSTIIESGLFSSVVVVVRKKDLSETESKIKKYAIGDLSKVFFEIGADDRTDSFLNGFEKLTKNKLVDEDSMVALFDANRPLTPKIQIKSLFEIALKAGCSCPARPVINGVARIEGNKIVEVPEKNKFIEFVTPEFLYLRHFSNLEIPFLHGHNCFVEYALTNSCMPETILSTSLNSKLTYPEDKTFLEGLAVDNAIKKPEKLT